MFCTECGSRAEPGTRFCAECGAPFDEPATPAPAPRPRPRQPPPPPPAARPAPGYRPPPPVDRPPPPGPPLAGAARSARRRRLSPLVLVVVGVLALVIVAVSFLRGLGGGPDGADSPVAAVENLVEAAEKEDPAAALATLVPSEANDARDVYSELRKHMGSLVRRVGGIAGVALAASDLRLNSQDLGHGVARVAASSGRLSAALSGREVASVLVPHESMRANVSLGNERYEFVMVTREDGGWFVSPLLTAVQQVVDYARLPQPDFSLVDDDGGDGEDVSTKTPRELFDAIARAVNNRNVDGLLDLFSERETGMLRAYRPAIQELVSRIEGSLAVEVRDVDISKRSIGSDLVRLDLQARVGQCDVAIQLAHRPTRCQPQRLLRGRLST